MLRRCWNTKEQFPLGVNTEAWRGAMAHYMAAATCYKHIEETLSAKNVLDEIIDTKGENARETLERQHEAWRGSRRWESTSKAQV